MTSLLYSNWAGAIEKHLLDWADPSGQYKQSPMADWPLADFASFFAILFAYLTFVLVGTFIMKNSNIPALNTRPLQFLYNPLQVVCCSYMCIEAGLQAYRNGYSVLPCHKFNAAQPVMGNVLWLFYLSKILDFMDTVFIILGKKWKQLSFLHVYHHLSVLAIYWLSLRVGYDGEVYLTIVLNGFVHTIMYTYYFVSAHTKNIWWKKYLTVMQLIQFAAMNVQAYFVFSRNCYSYPRRVSMLYIFYVQSLFWLFINFFVRAYVIKAKCAPPSAKKLN